MTGADARYVRRRADERSGVLLLRAWVEDASSPALRVRITRIGHLGEQSTTVTATAEAACAIVQSWLDELLQAGSTAGSLPPGDA